MLEDRPLVLTSDVLEAARGRSEVGVSSCGGGEDHASDVLRLGVMFRLAITRPLKPFFRSCSLRFALVVPGPARGDDFCSVIPPSVTGNADAGDAIMHSGCKQFSRFSTPA